jgi:hypothetical protein
MKHRSGERWGWLGGWFGAFLWVLLLATIRIGQGNTFEGVAGFLLGAAAVALIFTLAPWRFPRTPYALLLLPLYVVLAVAVCWALWTYRDVHGAGLTWWSLLWALPLLAPLLTAGRRRWIDGES